MYITCTKNFMKSGHVVFGILQLTDIHTDTLTAIFRTAPGGEIKILAGITTMICVAC